MRDKRRKMLLVENNSSPFEITLNESSGNSGLLKFRGKFQEAEAVNKNKRVYPYDVLHENVERLMELAKKRGLIGELDHPCLTDADFRVFTTEGWKPFKELKIGDYVWSRVNGKMIKSRINSIIDQPYNGPSYKVKGKSIDCEFTGPHRFLLENRKKQEVYAKIEEIHNNRTEFSHMSIPKTAEWKGNSSDKFIISGIENDKKYANDLSLDTIKFVSFLGIYLAEGYLKLKSNRIEICQINEVGRTLIREMLKNFHSEVVWKETKNSFYTVDKRLYNYLLPLGNKYNKYVPSEVKNLDTPYLEELLHWFVIGDGTMLSLMENGSCKNCKTDTLFANMSKNQRCMFYSTSKNLIQDLHECLIKTNRCGTMSTEITKKDYLFAGRVIKKENKKPLYKINVSNSKNIHLDARFLKITQNHHIGRIFCLSVDNGNFYMESKGKCFWTGNCDSIVHFRDASHVITKLWWEGNILMGEGEILSTPHGKVLKALVNDGVRVGMSSRGVGNGRTNENGILVIEKGYKLITFDAVADPSTFDAFQEKVSNKIKKENNSDNFNRKINDSSINNINKDVLIAALNGIIKEQTEKVKINLY